MEEKKKMKKKCKSYFRKFVDSSVMIFIVLYVCEQESYTHGVQLLLSPHNLYLKIFVLMQSQYHRGICSPVYLHPIWRFCKK